MPQTRSRGSRRHGSTAPHPSANPADQFALAFGTYDVSNTHRGTDDTPNLKTTRGMAPHLPLATTTPTMMNPTPSVLFSSIPDSVMSLRQES
ncbi:hypothetical protein ACHAWO_012724 [Cyclotella atomus]|uniref:Uncharacterized protein n=1 Tax=Cyclotella atomus TaxID=382360 RepID=A0ABD3Q0E7_9STRA